MKCQDVRRTLSFLVAGELALTEWAIIQAHLQECAECRKEHDRLRLRASALARAKRRRATVVALAATVVLVVGGGGILVYQRSLSGSAGSEPFRLFPWGTPAPPRAAEPTAPALTTTPPVPVSRPAPPPPARPSGAVEVTPRDTLPPASPVAPAVEPTRRATRPAATRDATVEDRMPTQARPPAAPTAPPDAEAMPTQGAAGAVSPRPRR